MRRKKRYFSRGALTVLAAVFAFMFLMPTVLTITNSFMTQSEITANYGQVFQNATNGKSYIKDTINLKFIPDKVSFSQYFTVLLKSPDFLYKFWNSVILVAPIVLAQLMVASVAAYGFTRWRGCQTIWCPIFWDYSTRGGRSSCPARSHRSRCFCSQSPCAAFPFR